jgi:hypothetical protein
LAEDTVFIEDTTKPIDNAGIKVGRYIKTDNRFITEYTPEGYMKIQFGAATTTPNQQLQQFANLGTPLKIQNYQNNIGLGVNCNTKFNTICSISCRWWRTASNVGVGVINQVGLIDFAVNGPSTQINQSVIQSLKLIILQVLLEELITINRRRSKKYGFV